MSLTASHRAFSSPSRLSGDSNDARDLPRELRRQGEPEAWSSLPDPVAAEGEALIEIKAAGVNPVEPGMCEGMFRAVLPFTFPQVMGFDMSGVVVTAPAGSAFSPGDEVYARPLQSDPGRLRRARRYASVAAGTPSPSA